MKQHMEMQSKKAMDRLREASGAAFDQAFVDEMSSHHQMAIKMVEDTRFKDEKLNQLAQKMAAGQKKELTELKQVKARSS